MKTKKETAHEYAGCKEGDPIPNEAWEKIRAFQAGIKFAEEWIPVERELPGKVETVLIKERIAGGKEDFVTGKFYKSGFWASVSYLIKPTHWRPINHK
ncbi:hypothetical protein EZS27_022505 [termite gut metagenome]|uniref:DUF551 domain-containing protein n=1 Tax=termite gut metagenome TaxID=433724 RepID=A0A5J4R398_9ZZZZ